MKVWFEEYYKQITSGKIIACKKIIQQLEILHKIYIEGINNPKSKWYYDEEAGNDPIFFIEHFCRHSKGKWAGKLITLELWQKAFISALYGFIDRETGLRKYKEGLMVVARKNGKTTLAAGLGLYGFLGDGEGGPQVYCAANKLDQAKLLYNEARNMVNQSSVLTKMVKRTRTTLESRPDLNLFASFGPLASDSTTSDGLNPSLAIYDEIHAAKTDELYSVIKQGMSARNQPLIIQITTNGFVREGLFDNQYAFAENMLNETTSNSATDSLLAFIYEQDSKEEIENEDMWIKSNPNLGVSKTKQYLREQIDAAKSKPSEWTTVYTKDFNVPQNSKDGWLDLVFLKYHDTYTDEEIKNNYVIGGADLSEVLDLTCATILLEKKDNPGILYVKQQYFMPQEKLAEKNIQDKVPYHAWVEQGWITATPGNRVDNDYITEWFFNQYKQLGLIPYWIGYDRWAATDWIKSMNKRGFNRMESVIQGPKTFSPAMKLTKSMLESGKINYNNNPVLRWCLTNVVKKLDEGGNEGPDKKHSNGRIDGAVSLLDAMVIYNTNRLDYRKLQRIE